MSLTAYHAGKNPNPNRPIIRPVLANTPPAAGFTSTPITPPNPKAPIEKPTPLSPILAQQLRNKHREQKRLDRARGRREHTQRNNFRSQTQPPEFRRRTFGPPRTDLTDSNRSQPQFQSHFAPPTAGLQRDFRPKENYNDMNKRKSIGLQTVGREIPKIERPRPPKKRMQQKAETPGILLQPLLTTPNRTYSAPSDKLRIIPLGGLGEIGKNMTAIEYGNDIIVIDCGVMFPSEEMLGIDLVIPDVSYLVENRAKLKGIFFTHGHEDHISGIGYVLPRLGDVPLYALPLTASLIEGKLQEFDNRFAQTKVNKIKTRQKIKLGIFTIEPFSITHSIPDSVAYAIDTPEGVIVYTTDWKFDHTPIWGEPTDFQKLIELSNRGVKLLTSDSTNAEESGYTISERVVGEKIDTIFDKETKGRIIVSCFASLLNRIQMVVNSAAAHGRKVAVYGRSMENNVKRAFELGYFKAPKDTLINGRDIGKYPDDKLAILCTGSQGEEYSALVRMASGEHRQIQLREGDVIVISASQIPGNEHAIHSTIDNLFRQGARVYHGHELDVHTSGHAKSEELKMLISIVKPQFFLPIHGDYRFLKAHAELAKQVGIPPKNIFVGENGSVLEIKGDEARWGARVPGGNVLIDGLGVGDVGQIVLRDRQAMAEEGIFMVILTVSRQTGQLLSSPDIISRGFVYVRAAENLMYKARNEVKQIFAHHKAKGPMDWEYVKRTIREELSHFLYEYTQRRPMVIPVVIEV